VGIASNQGPGDDGEDDFEHLRNIRSVLSSWHYTNIGEFYDGSQGGGDAAGNPTSASIASGRISKK
jgi:gingipain R